MEEGPSKRRVHSLNLLDHTLFFYADANSDLRKLRDVVSRTCGVSYARLSLLTVVWTTLSNLCVLPLSRSLRAKLIGEVGVARMGTWCNVLFVFTGVLEELRSDQNRERTMEEPLAIDATRRPDKAPDSQRRFSGPEGVGRLHP